MTPLDGSTFQDAVDVLAAADPHVGKIVAERGVPAFWHRPPGFATLVLFIIEQQVSLASAQAVFGRLNELLGGVTPETVASCDRAALERIGLTRQKRRYITELADAVLARRLDLEAVAGKTDEDARRELLSLIGVGPWTADVYLLSALRRPDVWPVGDRALQVGTAEVLGLTSVPDPTELLEIGERWRPWRSVAARLVWHDYLSRRGRTEPDVKGL